MQLSTALGAALLILTFTGSLQAAPTQCDTKIEGEPVTIFYDSTDASYSSLRERVLRRGQTCPASVVITYLMPDLTAEEREVFCANYDPNTKSHSLPAQGRRDSYGRCAEPSKTCKLVNATKQEGMALMGLGKKAAEEEQGAVSTITAVSKSPGVMILSGNAGPLSTLLTSTGAALGAAVGSSTLVAGAAASVVIIGGAVYLCSDED